jgi:hypothetical protein
MHIPVDLSPAQKLLPLAVALVIIAAFSLLREPARRTWSALFIAGAGAAYLAGGFGPWEMIFPLLMTPIAYWGLKDYRFLGAGWLLHAGWDVLHHLYGNPILPFDPASSAGCAICDVGLAAWYFFGAPSIFGVGRRKSSTASGVGTL